MKHHTYIGIPLFIAFAISFFFPLHHTWAVTKLSTWTTPFGGRVLTTKIPTVDCPGAVGTGTAPVVLSSNIAGVAQATVGAVSKGQTTVSRVGKVVGGIYKAIPLYTVRISSVTGQPLTQPKPGDWILGMQYLVPNVHTCETDAFGTPIPFPVVKTDNYGVSR